MTYRYKLFFLLTIVWISQYLASCKKMIEVGTPQTEITSQDVYTSDASATAAARGMYTIMSSDQSFTNAGTDLNCGLSADELINYSSNNEQSQFYKPGLTSVNTIVANNFWKEAYSYIFNSNSLLNGLGKSTGLSAEGKNQLTGEAKFIRAFCHFYLVNLFGDVPYVTTTDYQANLTVSRTPASEVYKNIIQDLLDAQNLMADDFIFSNGERIEPNKGAATALLARVYLYLGDWANAEMQATLLINNSVTYALEPDLNKVFLGNSSETIWQIKPVVPGINTQQGLYFILTDAPVNTQGGVALNPVIVNAFEPGDARKDNWVGTFSDGTTTYYFPYKYKIAYSSDITEYNMVLRLAEQFLIRAEARTQLNNFSGAQDDINAIRHRAGLGDTPANDKISLLETVQQERKLELFTEWGHRWLDLKRTGMAGTVLAPVKTDWQATDTLYPIPHTEIIADPNLKQNPGY